ncbi:hypothetical protein CARUB_v10003599mg [Capsella rubella]|uniref:Uncharacterized protein n=1 Tax=Capsella rubella TaxID=81985 RepID=R0HGE3_9BRAS|nr:hypothetical protein CARUB_v10003599mg [Capsella rubella]
MLLTQQSSQSFCMGYYGKSKVLILGKKREINLYYDEVIDWALLCWRIHLSSSQAIKICTFRWKGLNSNSEVEFTEQGWNRYSEARINLFPTCFSVMITAFSKLFCGEEFQNL